MAKAIIRAEEKKRSFMLEKFCEMAKLMGNDHASLGSLSITFRGGEEECVDVALQYPDCHSFHIYSFSNLEEIKESFGLIKKYILKGERVPYDSSVDVRRNKTIDYLNYATDSAAK